MKSPFYMNLGTKGIWELRTLPGNTVGWTILGGLIYLGLRIRCVFPYLDVPRHIERKDRRAHLRAYATDDTIAAFDNGFFHLYRIIDKIRQPQLLQGFGFL